MKNLDSKKFIMTVVAVVVSLAIYDLGKSYVDKSKTTPPATA